MFNRAIRPAASVTGKERELKRRAEAAFEKYSLMLFTPLEKEKLVGEHVKVELEKFKKDQQEEQLRNYLYNLSSI